MCSRMQYSSLTIHVSVPLTVPWNFDTWQFQLGPTKHLENKRGRLVLERLIGIPQSKVRYWSSGAVCSGCCD